MVSVLDAAAVATLTLAAAGLTDLDAAALFVLDAAVLRDAGNVFGEVIFCNSGQCDTGSIGLAVRRSSLEGGCVVQ